MNHGLSKKHLAIIQSILKPYKNLIEGVFLFGSRATGMYRANSDIDLVLKGSIPETTIDRISTLFMESSLPFSVDIKSYELTTYPALKKRIDEVIVPLFPETISEARVYIMSNTIKKKLR